VSKIIRITAIPLISAGMAMQGAAQTSSPGGEDPYGELARETRPLATRWEVDYSGEVEAGAGYVSQDNFMFGQYNGLYEQGGVFIGNVAWRGWHGDGPRYFDVEARDLGLETRRGLLEWGSAGRFRLGLLFDNQIQIKNNDSRTPFLGVGSSDLTLPSNWQSGANTSDWTTLDGSLRGFDRELKRHTYGLQFDSAIGGGWSLKAALTTEHKEGTTDTGGAIYIDASNPHAVLLPQPIDQRTTQFDLAFDYAGEASQWNIAYYFSHFDNQEDTLTWQNPYDANYDAVAATSGVDFPNGYGGLAVAPDNQFHRLRLGGSSRFAPRWMLQLDGSYGRAFQDDQFPDYTVNRLLAVNQPVPRTSLDATMDTATLNGALLFSATRKLNLEARYRLYDRQNDSPRDGYLYVRGDGGDQPADTRYSNYNAPHDTRKQRGSLEASYRLPKRNKVILEYAYERVDRRNASVEHTDENIFSAQFNTSAWQPLNARFELQYSDLAADTYQWDQSYYARFDADLINETPDTQRYTNHPLLSQYHLANRERLLGKVDLNYLLAQDWSLALNMLWRRDDFDESTLGLTDEYWDSYILSANYRATETVNLTGYLNYNRYKASQTSRNFRGGAEKNAFVTTGPFPQASDPGQNWDVDTDDTVGAIGVALQWQAMERLNFDFDYSYVDTKGENSFKSFGASTTATEPLPDRRTRQHQLSVQGSWHLRDNLALNLDYRYWHFASDNWAIDGVEANTIDKVLTFGEDSADENVNYLGLSVSYRLR